jgi:hypothetical protein
MERGLKRGDEDEGMRREVKGERTEGVGVWRHIQEQIWRG